MWSWTVLDGSNFWRVRTALIFSALSKFEQFSIDADLADAAAELAQTHKLAMADALVYAASLTVRAELWTQDKDFERLPNVKYFPKK